MPAFPARTAGGYLVAGFITLLAANPAGAMGTPPQTAPASKPAPSTGSSMLKDDDLRAGPDATTKLLARLGKGQAVKVLANQGGWTQVSAAGQTGWVRVLSVRNPSSGVGLGDLNEAASARDPGKVVAVAGTRGLDEETLRGAKFNGEELRLLESHALGREEAERFGRAAGLTPRTMPYLKGPAATKSPDNDPWGMTP